MGNVNAGVGSNDGCTCQGQDNGPQLPVKEVKIPRLEPLRRGSPKIHCA